MARNNALHAIVYRLERALMEKVIALCASRDIEVAFDSISYQSIQRISDDKAVKAPTIKWIQFILQNHKIAATLGKIKYQ